jgi:hypothetical protein
MSYDECLMSTFLHAGSWTVLGVGLGLAVLLSKRGRRVATLITVCTTMLLAVSWSYTWFELNCVELL